MSDVTLRFRKEAGFAWKIPQIVRVIGAEPPDDMLESERSRVRVLEDGLPLALPHQPHTEIRSLGAGRYSHWTDHVLFSTSDNTSPLTNGRCYELLVGDSRLLVIPPDLPLAEVERLEEELAERRRTASGIDGWVRHHQGSCWRIDLAAAAEELGFAPHSGRPALGLREDGCDLVPDPAGLAALVHGAHGRTVPESPEGLYFTATDGSNPKLNGRTYTLVVDGRTYPLPRSRQAIVLTMPSVAPSPVLADLVRRAAAAGRDRRAARPDADGASAADYRDFLAGLCDVEDCRRVLEIGTEHGHTTKVLVEALGDRLDAFGTIDIVDHCPGMRLPPGAFRLLGDALRADVLTACLARFDHRPIDLLFVDSAHDYASTLSHYAVYAALLRPRFVVLDDIVLNEAMATLWRDLRRVHGPDAVNACDLDPWIRLGDCGFGILDLRADRDRPAGG
jgi:predicted O-methyltransferase YrrM